MTPRCPYFHLSLLCSAADHEEGSKQQSCAACQKATRDLEMRNTCMGMESVLKTSKQEEPTDFTADTSLTIG